MLKNLLILFCFNFGLTQAQDLEYAKKIDVLKEKVGIHFYSKQDSAYYYIEQIRQLAKTNNDNIREIEAIFDKCGVASFFFDLKTSDSGLKSIASLLNNLNKNSIEYTTHYNTLLYYQGDFFLKQYDYKRSRESFEAIRTSFESMPDSLKNQMQIDLYSASFSFLGKIYLEEGKYTLAKQLYNKSIRNLIKNYPNELEALYDNYNLLAEVYQEEKHYSKANSYLLKTLPYNIENNNTNNIISQAFKIAKNYNMLSQLDSANYYLNIAKPYFDENSFFMPRYHKVKSEIYLNSQDYNLAIKELTTALEVAKSKFKGSKFLEIPVIYNKMGNIFLLQENPKKALEYFNLGLVEAFKIANNKSILLKLIKNKTRALNKLGSKGHFEETFKNVDLGIVILDSLKPSFKSNDDKLVLIEDAFPLFESGIEATYELYKTTKEEVFINKAFRFAEKSKAVILLDALLGAKATKFANIPQKLLETESLLKSQITHLKSDLNGEDKNLTEGADELFSLQQKHSKLIETFEKNYPDYYNLKYNSEVLSLKKMKRELSVNQIFISFFYGNNYIYFIGVVDNESFFERIKISKKLNDDIIEFHALSSNPKSEIDLIHTLGFDLYQKLLEPILENNKQNELIIAPDGLLNYIPYGSLVTNIDSKRFLIQDRAISYINSASLWSQLKTKKQTNNSLLAFAPGFNSNISSDDTRSGVLGNLPHNKKEVEQISTSFNGRSFVDNDATLQNFTANVSNHSILHLATHAVFDDKNPEYSYLAFTPNEESEDILLVKDLYNLSLNASLVTLSACESAIGELKRGEGFLSLARGFFYSGASSISSTLWKINDNSSSALMGSFYENLADGKSKDISLQEAKLSFLEKNRENGLSHPYYWSGYIIQGNTEPLTSNTSWWWYLLGGPILILIFLGRKRLLQRFK